MTDYQGNSRKKKEEATKPAKSIEKVITGDVVKKKRSVGRKFKDIFIVADPKSVFRYVVGEVLLPAAKNMFVDAVNAGSKRMVYGEAATRMHNLGSKTTYHTPVSRPYPNAAYPSPPPSPRRIPRQNMADTFQFSQKVDAEMVLQTMQDIIDKYGMVTLADVNEMIGETGAYTDEKWGWALLPGADIIQNREGFLLILPPVEAIQ